MNAIYLDNNATTPVLPEVLEAMLPYLREHYGNPSSLHRLGMLAARGLNEARAQVARALACEPDRVVFTSGGTEANNLALQGAVRALRRRGDHMITTAVEHASVLEVCRGLEEEGLRVTYLPVTNEGLRPATVAAAVETGTILVSVMHVQNETGAVFPIEAIARAVKARSKRLFVHSDGVQAFGKLPAPGDAVDLYTISAHKAHGPKGAGALRLGPKARVLPLLRGGGHERGLRSGTEPLPALVGLGAAARVAHAGRAAFARRAAELGGRLRAGIEALGGLINSPPDGVPTTVNVSFPGVAAEPLLHALEAEGVYVSTGSACSSHKGGKSPVLRALGLSPERVDSAVRFSLSRETSAEEVEEALRILAGALGSFAASQV